MNMAVKAIELSPLFKATKVGNYCLIRKLDYLQYCIILLLKIIYVYFLNYKHKIIIMLYCETT